MDSSTRASLRRPGGCGVLGLVVLVGLSSGCGPSPDQLSATALASAPISYVLALLAVWGLHGLWRAQIGAVRPRWGLASIYALALSAIAVIVTRGASLEPDVFAVGAFLSGGTCVAGSMLVGRFGLRRARAGHDYSHSVTIAPALVTALVYAPFLLTWLESGALEEVAFTVALALVGIGGTYVAGPLIFGLVVETVFARARVSAAAD